MQLLSQLIAGEAAYCPTINCYVELKKTIIKLNTSKSFCIDSCRTWKSFFFFFSPNSFNIKQQQKPLFCFCHLATLILNSHFCLKMLSRSKEELYYVIFIIVSLEKLAKGEGMCANDVSLLWLLMGAGLFFFLSCFIHESVLELPLFILIGYNALI